MTDLSKYNAAFISKLNEQLLVYTTIGGKNESPMWFQFNRIKDENNTFYFTHSQISYMFFHIDILLEDIETSIAFNEAYNHFKDLKYKHIKENWPTVYYELRPNEKPLPSIEKKEVIKKTEVVSNKPVIDAKKAEKEANKLELKEAKEKQKELQRIEREKNQKEVKEITINIEWKKSRTWGSIPNCEAEIRFKDGSYGSSPIYKAGGCGYDKESTVIADVFNDYLLYKLHKIGAIKEHPYGIYLREDWKHYNGGVGTNCYYKIAEFIGGKFERISFGKTFDVYKYTDLK